MSDDRDQPRTLKDEDIVAREGREVGRRRAVGLLGVSAASALALATGCARRARVERVPSVSTGLTDHDGGPCADAIGAGRGYSGITDADAGPCADPDGRGRGDVVERAGITDSDEGACADPAGAGRGHSGLTDSDAGDCSDPAGRGRSG